MTSTKHQECYKTFIKNMEGEEFIQIDTPTIYQHDCDSVTGGGDSNDGVVIHADGNFYYQPASGKKVKLAQVQNVSDIPVKKLAAGVGRSPNKQTNDALASSPTIQNCNVDVEKIKCEENDIKGADVALSSEIDNEDKVYEFDETEQDVVSSQEVDDPDYKTKGIIKKGKKAKDQETAWFTCMICSYRTGKKFLLSRHLKTHCDERPFQCGVCERQFKTKSALMNHRNIHLGYKPHACSSCDMTFTTSGELIRHERYRHTHIKPHKCTECDYSSVERSKLRRHIRCHTGERPYQCPQCTYASPDTFKLKRHMRIHTGEKPYECDICHSRFTQSNSLKQHRLIHSVNDKPVFQCHLCPTTCGRKTDLRLHIKNLHSSDHPIPCKRCGKELPDRYSYKMHIKTHEGEKCYRCEYCSFASISERHLESHMLIHMNSKPFVCDICGNSFRQKQLLKRHAKIYHSEKYEAPQPRKKDHKCPYCNKMFAFNGNLIRHMQIHDTTSRLYEETQQLKIGRMKRVQPDGTVLMETSCSSLSKLLEDSQELCYKESEEQHTNNEELLQAEYEENEELNEDNIQYVYDEYETEEYEELHEAEQYEQQQEENNVKTILIDIKPERIQPIDITQEASSKKSIINLKTEHKNGSEIMVLEQNDDEGFMVIEVMPDDDDDDNEQQEEEVKEFQFEEGKPTINKNNKKSDVKKSHKNSQSLISDYFGFEVNAEEEEDNDDDEETKGVIKMLEMIEEE